ncbi:hypothetical protein MNBD_GAMMA22-170 [hydrothermal vent metagenome]|uniref:Uncharacterized protein n=1 Tax=hydrothermal vent metagenome TaxID=652676 RepID=A0A3B1A7Y8_9ZZZZ
MSYEYEQAVRQRDSFANKIPSWLTLAIIGFFVFVIIIFTISLFNADSGKNDIVIEFQKTLFEQSNELMDVNFYLANEQDKDKRYFVKLQKYSNQIEHRFQIISEFIVNNDLDFNSKKFTQAEKMYRKKMETILKSQKDLISYHKSLSKLQKNLPKLLTLNTEINNLLFKSNSSNTHIYFITRQLYLLERITSNVTALNIHQNNASSILSAADRLGRDMALLIRVYRGLLKGDYKMNVSKINNLKVRRGLNKVTKLATSLSKDIAVLLQQGSNAFQFIDMRNGLQIDSLKLQVYYQALFFVEY